MAIPMLDIPSMLHEPIRDELIQKLVEVVDSARYINGPYVEQFETELADYVGSERAVGVSSGTDALIIALKALGAGPGDEVITTAFTFFATVGSIARVGATPVFADIDPVTFNIDPVDIEAKVTDRTVGVVAVDLFGQAADMTTIADLADKHGLWVVEDAAQSIGAMHNGRMCGTLGTIGTYSFFPAKNLGALGDGGAAVTDDRALADKMTMLRQHGAGPEYHHKLIGGNFRLDAIQAAALSVKLPHLKGWEETRRRAAATYAELLEDDDRFVTPVELDGNRHVYNQYELRVKDGLRDKATEALRRAEIGHAIYYPVPLHLQECFAELGGKEGDLPVSEQASREVLAVPVMAEPGVCEVVADVLKSI